MAINVYLVIFRRWTARQVKSLYKYYLPICYTIPLIPALVCLIYKDRQHGRMYGNAGVCPFPFPDLNKVNFCLDLVLD